MPTAILIAFEYLFKPLPGALIDLYNAYKWCKSFNCTIHIITDIESTDNHDNYQQAFDKRIVDADLVTFYNNLNNIKIVKTERDFLNAFLNVTDDKLIIYYSGHGVKDYMVMPDKSNVQFIKFRNTLLSKLPSYTEIFWILDCCNPNGLHLPFKLEDNSFKLSSNQVECVSQPILLIISSNSEEKSVATKYGSIFSRHLFRILSSMKTNRNLKRLISNISSNLRKMHTGYSQTISIYSSYVIDPILWLWIGSNKSYDIVADMSLSTLIIRDIGTLNNRINYSDKL